jgi:lysophospholipase L1-like esterase
MTQRYILLFLLFLLNFNFVAMAQTTQKTYSLLSLGDSYTIGESVSVEERFPMRVVDLLAKENINFNEPTIVAKTGWTTDELGEAIKQAELKKRYDFVTLLIGVNNQYRERDLKNYEKEFSALLQTAVDFVGGKEEHVIVVSIPDWGVTPFVANDAKKRTGEQISKEVAAYNEVNKKVAKREKVHYVDIYLASQNAKNDPTLLAEDGLHPSGKMYADWAEKVAHKIKDIIR